MIIALPVSHIVNETNYFLIPGVGALEYRTVQPLLDKKLVNLFHSNYGIIQEGFIEYCDSVSDFLVTNQVQVFSFDLGPAAEQVEIKDYYYIPKSELLTKEELYKKIQLRLNYIKSIFNGYVAVENLNYFQSPAYEYVCEAEFISNIVRTNDIYMVLDIAHAIITANNTGVDKYEYFSKLPLERVKVIHLSAPCIKDAKWRDLHEVPSSEEYEILKFIKNNLAGEAYLIVEYYKDFNILQDIYRKSQQY